MRTICAIAVLGLVLAIVPAAAADELPPCPASVIATERTSEHGMPSEAVVGVMYPVVVLPGAGTATFESVDGRPLSHPFTGTGVSHGSGGYSGITVPVRLESDDPPAQIRIVWIAGQLDPATHDVHLCRATAIYGPITAVPQAGCSDDRPAYDVTAPSRVAVGRDADVVVAAAHPLTDGAFGLRVTVDDIVSATAVGRFPVSFGPGVSQRAYAVGWMEDRGRCMRSVTGVIRLVDGSAPRIAAGVIGTPTLRAVTPVNCSSAAVGAVTFTVRSDRQTRSAVLGDQCLGWTTPPSRSPPRSWKITALSRGEGGAAPALRFQLRKGRRNVTQRFAFDVTWNGRTLRSGHVIATATYRHGRLRTAYRFTK